jgi:hypothetical protein
LADHIRARITSMLRIYVHEFRCERVRYRKAAIVKKEQTTTEEVASLMTPRNTSRSKTQVFVSNPNRLNSLEHPESAILMTRLASRLKTKTFSGSTRDGAGGGGCGTTALRPVRVSGVIAMKITSSTRRMSMNGVTLMSDRGRILQRIFFIASPVNCSFTLL